MTKFGRNIRNLFCVLLAVVLCVSCAQNDDELELVTGKLHLKIGTVSDKTSTRATPAALGKPLVSKFKIKAQRTSSGKVDYDGPFAETIEVRCSDYDITAYCGENVILGKDAPYYEGTAHVTVEKDKHNSVTIPCRVANALLRRVRDFAMVRGNGKIAGQQRRSDRDKHSVLKSLRIHAEL